MCVIIDNNKTSEVSMGTRGVIGFKVNGKYFLTYNHWDSYIDGLGYELFAKIEEIRKENRLQELKKKVLKLKAVDSQGKPTKKQLERYQNFLNLNVNDSTKHTNWYQLLHNCQGVNFITTILDNNLGHYIESKDFVYDSLFCEYGYIIDFDTNNVNIYVGFQRASYDKNEFGITPDKDGYYPIKKIYECDLRLATLEGLKKLVETKELAG